MTTLQTRGNRNVSAQNWWNVLEKSKLPLVLI